MVALILALAVVVLLIYVLTVGAVLVRVGELQESQDNLTDLTLGMSQDIEFLLFVVEENLTDEQRERVRSSICKCGDGCTCCDSKCEDEKIGLTD